MTRLILAFAIAAFTTLTLTSASLAANEWFFNPDNGDVVEGPVGSPQSYINLGPQPSAAAAQAAARSLKKVQGTIQSIQGPTATLKTDDGKTLTFDAAQLGTPGRVKVGDRATVMAASSGATTATTASSGPDWFFNPDNGDVIPGPVGSPAAYINLGPQPSSAAAQAAARAVQRVTGTVVSSQGNTVTFRADDGRTLALDASQMPARSLSDFKSGERLTVLGFDGRTDNQFVPRFALKATGPAPARSQAASTRAADWYYNPVNGDVVRGPVGSPQSYVHLGRHRNAAAAQAAAKASQQVRGQVQSVDSSGITVKTDDGRLLTVETARLDQRARGRLAAGQMVTLYGRYVTDANTFRPSFVREDGGSALPRSR